VAVEEHDIVTYLYWATVLKAVRVFAHGGSSARVTGGSVLLQAGLRNGRWEDGKLIRFLTLGTPSGA